MGEPRRRWAASRSMGIGAAGNAPAGAGGPALAVARTDALALSPGGPRTAGCASRTPSSGARRSACEQRTSASQSGCTGSRRGSRSCAARRSVRRRRSRAGSPSESRAALVAGPARTTDSGRAARSPSESTRSCSCRCPLSARAAVVASASTGSRTSTRRTSHRPSGRGCAASTSPMGAAGPAGGGCTAAAPSRPRTRSAPAPPSSGRAPSRAPPSSTRNSACRWRRRRGCWASCAAFGSAPAASTRRCTARPRWPSPAMTRWSRASVTVPWSPPTRPAGRSTASAAGCGRSRAGRSPSTWSPPGAATTRRPPCSAPSSRACSSATAGPPIGASSRPATGPVWPTCRAARTG